MVDVDEVDFFFKKILKKYSNIDILVNNVGRSEPGDPESMTFKTWHEQFNVNLDSAFLCIFFEKYQYSGKDPSFFYIYTFYKLHYLL